MDDLVAKLKILLRAEKTLHRAEVQRRINLVMLSAMSIACLLVALIFVNLGLFFEFSNSDVSSRAAFILAAGNFVLALLPQLFKLRAKPGPEEKMVEEIRDMALAEVNRDLDRAVQSVSSFGSGIKQLAGGGSPFGGGLASLTPIIGIVIDLLKKRKS